MTPPPPFHDTKVPLSQDAALRYAEREGAISNWCKSSRLRPKRLDGERASERPNETSEVTARGREPGDGANRVPASFR